MRNDRKKTHIRINGKRFAVSVLVLLLAVCAGIFLIRGLHRAALARAAAAEEARLAEEQRIAEEERLAAEAAKNDAERQAEIAARVYAYENGYLTLLNKENSVDESYAPADLTAVDEAYACADRPSSTHLMRKEAAEAFAAMIAAAKADGYEIKMTTAYRSYSYQNALYTNYVSKYGQEEADRFSAKPGTSEHQSGLASDIASASVSWQLTNKFGQTEEGKWIAAHAADYGFILRYPEENSEERTGYVYEPWHVRYVTVPVAKEITEKELVLEEYLALYDWPSGTAK